ncbi:MAG: hypothetical protein A4E55_00361 [Pelotomaculum sp. PtaU1.Bin035]|nr:MAG: hypothetical protein A4E55_00361 [Pelotomaculum sp. PtaU1.Bin035]
MRRYSEEVKRFISENVRGITTKDLAALVNAEFGLDFTESKMKAYKTNHGLKSGRRGIPAGRPSKLYPDNVKDFIKANHKGVGPKEMAKLLNEAFGTNYTHSQMKAWYDRHKLNSGVTGYFPKGNIPFNKNKKGVFLGGEAAEAAQFKPGHKAWNWVPVGSERVNADGYVDIKVDDGKLQKNWKGKHIVIWEAANGPVPPGHVIIFGDGNNRNFDLDNLILVSRKQLVRLNQCNLIQNDIELTKTGIIIADISNKIGERKKKRINAHNVKNVK